MLFLSIGFLACSASQENISFVLNPANDTIQINSEYDDPGVTAKVFGLKRSTEVVENTVDTSKTGVYHIIYNFVYKEFDMTLVRIVTVIDDTPPEINLNPGIDTIKLGTTWEDASITYEDNSNEEVVITTVGEVNNNLIGTYIITYTATDASGNIASIKRYVSVIE